MINYLKSSVYIYILRSSKNGPTLNLHALPGEWTWFVLVLGCDPIGGVTKANASSSTLTWFYLSCAAHVHSVSLTVLSYQARLPQFQSRLFFFVFRFKFLCNNFPCELQPERFRFIIILGSRNKLFGLQPTPPFSAFIQDASQTPWTHHGCRVQCCL